MSIDERLEHLERSTRRWRITTIGLGLATVVTFAIAWPGTPPPPPPPPTELKLGRTHKIAELNEDYFRIGFTFVNEKGITSEWSTDSDEIARSSLWNNNDGADLNLETGRVSFKVRTRERTAIVPIVIAGKVTSEIDVDTDTGAWTITRYRDLDRHGKPEFPVTTQLLAPLPPP